MHPNDYLHLLKRLSRAWDYLKKHKKTERAIKLLGFASNHSEWFFSCYDALDAIAEYYETQSRYQFHRYLVNRDPNMPKELKAFAVDLFLALDPVRFSLKDVSKYIRKTELLYTNLLRLKELNDQVFPTEQ